MEDALAQYAEEKAALSGTRDKEKADLDAAYQALKGEVSRVLEAQHAKNLTDAVNTTWERAAVQEEKAVAQAVERVKQELRIELEEQLGTERMQLRAEARRTIAEHEEALAAFDAILAGAAEREQALPQGAALACHANRACCLVLFDRLDEAVAALRHALEAGLSVQQVEDTRDPLQAMGVRKPNQLVLHSVAAQWQVAVAQLQSKVAAQ